jgi:hypothetical protein
VEYDAEFCDRIIRLEDSKRREFESCDHLHFAADWGRRMLIPEDHDKLVQELYVLRDTYGYEVNVVSMDKLSRMEQLHLAGRTTVWIVCLFLFRPV